MDLSCTFLETTDKGQRPVFKILSRDGIITGRLINPRSAMMMDAVLADDPLRIGSMAFPKSNPEAYMRALPHAYSGERLRAQLQDARGKDIQAVSPPGWRGTTEHMKDHPEITNPYALAWSMYKKGDSSHKAEPPDTPRVKVSKKTKKARQKALEEKDVKTAADGFGPGEIARNVIREKALGVESKAYKLAGYTSFQGLPISIENRKGDIRKGLDHDGTPWSVKMPCDYGYIKGTQGSDGDEVDCFIGPLKNAKFAYIFHIENDADHTYDEDKCFLGFSSDEAARKIFNLAYDNAGEIFHSVTMLPMHEFIEKVLHTHDLKRPGKIHAEVKA
jgi:hypothetical protein